MSVNDRSNPFSLLRLALLAGLMFTALTTSAYADAQTAKVRELIDQLGAESYATRIRAKEELRQLGLEAFDELHQAQFDPDNEIAMSARFLVNSLMVSWSKESDPPEVRDALSEYGAQDATERSSRIQMLAEFPDRKGLDALARLVRFETSLRLSRQAALAVMEQTASEDSGFRRRSAETIVATLGDNQRQGSQWLRAYAEDLTGGGYSAERWRDLIDLQRKEIDTAATQQSNRQSVLDLVRICAMRAAGAGSRDEALRLATDHIDLIAPKTRELRDACSWAIDNDLHPFVLALRQRHERMYRGDAFLLYNAAEAEGKAGNSGEAETLAQAALEIRPLPKDEDEKAKLRPKEIQEAAESHRLIAATLSERGLFQWAEREYRQIIDALEINAQPSAFAQTRLAYMLGEMNRHDDVVEVLEPLVKRVGGDGELQKRFQGNNFNYRKIESIFQNHAALSILERGDGDKEQARKLLMEAYLKDRENVDVLISMYRLNGDEDWNDEVARRLKTAIKLAQSEVNRWEGEERRQGRLAAAMLAEKYNQYAWLVSNTEGEYKKALQYSKRSLELVGGFEQLDTCARCYYALGDLPNAIRMQKRALKLQPHSPPLQRQLAEFEAALAHSSPDNAPINEEEQAGDASKAPEEDTIGKQPS